MIETTTTLPVVVEIDTVRAQVIPPMQGSSYGEAWMAIDVTVYLPEGMIATKTLTSAHKIDVRMQRSDYDPEQEALVSCRKDISDQLRALGVDVTFGQWKELDNE